MSGHTSSLQLYALVDKERDLRYLPRRSACAPLTGSSDRLNHYRVACGSIPEPLEGRDPSCRHAGSHGFLVGIVHTKALIIYPTVTAEMLRGSPSVTPKETSFKNSANRYVSSPY